MARRPVISLAIVDDLEIRRVNRMFLGKDRPTDVISFLYDDVDAGNRGAAPEGPFGEIVVSAECALREARARGIGAAEELERYAIHGLLHILGYDDATSPGRRRMRALERRYLRFSSRSIPRPGGRAPRRRRPPGRG